MTSHNGRRMKQAGGFVLYHCTTAEKARSIAASGFNNSEEYFLNNRLWSGVWLSSRPLDHNEGGGDTVVIVKLDLPVCDLARWEWTAEGRSYREWLVPAQIINRSATVEVLDQWNLSTVAA